MQSEGKTSAEKRAAGIKREKTCDWHQAREIMQSVPSPGKHAIGTKRGKTCNRLQAREKMQPAS